jgi:hypothetical protein
MESVAEPERPAPAHDAPGAPCDRCGTFAPLSVRWGKRWCASCLARRSRIETAPISLANLITDTFLLFQQVAGPALAITLGLLAIELAIRRLLPHGAAGQVFAFAYGETVMVAGMMSYQRLAFARVVKGSDSTLRGAVGHVVRVFPRALAAFLLAHLISGLLMPLLVVPGVLRALSYLLVGPLALVSPLSPTRCLDWSRRLMDGHRLVAALVTFTVGYAPLAGLLAVMTAVLGFAHMMRTISGVARPSGLVEYVWRPFMAVCFIPGHLTPIVLLLKLGHQFTEQSGPAQGAQLRARGPRLSA